MIKPPLGGWGQKYFLYFCLTKQMNNAKQTFYL